jgi:hypothetical protein
MAANLGSYSRPFVVSSVGLSPARNASLSDAGRSLTPSGGANLLVTRLSHGFPSGAP